MARTGFAFIIYGLLFLLLGCEAGPSIKEGAVVDEVDVTISSPAQGALIDIPDANAIIVRGKCLKNGEVISVSSGASIRSALCSNNQFQTTLNLSALPQGPYQIIASNSSYTAQVNIRLRIPPLPEIIFTTPTAPASFYNDSFQVEWQATGSLRSTDTFYVEAYANGSCTGVPFADGLQDTLSYAFAALVYGTTYSLRVRAYDEDGAEGIAYCSSSLNPDDTPATLDLSDATTLSTTFIRQVTARVLVTSNSVARKWCVSETETVAPAFSNTCFRTTKPTSIRFSTGDALKTAYVWTADAFGNVLQTTLTDTITLDSTKPVAPTIVVTDPVTLSTSQTKQALNDISIANDADAVAWCVVDLASTAATFNPAFNNACFTGVKPTTHSLIARGPRKVFILTLDAAGNVSFPGFGLIDWLVASRFIMEANTPDNDSRYTGGCLPVLITLQDSNNDPTTAGPAAFTVRLTETGTGILYTNSSCNTVATQVTIPVGETYGEFYFKTLVDENVIIFGSYTFIPSIVAIANFTTTPANKFSLSHEGQTCVITDGELQCFGLNNGTFFGQSLTTENVFIQNTGVKIPTMDTLVTDVSAGYDHTCAIKSGVLSCWGQNTFGQLGNNTVLPSLTPSAVTNTRHANSVSAGNQHTCAIFGESAFCSGRNDFGQLGDGTLVNKSVFTAIPDLTTGVSKIVSSSNYSCAIQNGGLKCWGKNDKGQLGNQTTTNSSSPVDVFGLTTGVVDVALDENWACAIQNESLYCWGTSEVGLGDGPAPTLFSNEPLAVQDAGVDAEAIALGKSHACVLISDVLNCWGRNDLGQFGNGVTSVIVQPTPVASPSPLDDILYVYSARNSNCALSFDFDQYCWGSNANNVLGTGAFTQSNVALATTGLTGTPDIVAVGSTNCVTMTDGTNQCWGAGDYRQIGDGEGLDQIAPSTTTTASSTFISSGNFSTCVVSASVINCWGTNFNLRLGQAAAVVDSDGANVQGIAALATNVSVSSLGSHACAVVNGGAMCWGNAQRGQLGIPLVDPNEDTASYVTGLGATSGVTKVAVGKNHSCALVADSVRCWGAGESRQLGNGSTGDIFSPFTAVASGATDVAAGDDYTCAVVSGALSCWGNVPVIGSLTTPTIHTDLISGVVAVSAGEFNTCVILSTGRVNCFGASDGGRLGNNLATVDSYTSVEVTNITSATSLAVGSSHSCAVDAAVVKCWGLDYYGALTTGIPFATATAAAPTLAP